jgi:hypothetical protein
MCKVYNSIGSLKIIRSHLLRNNINEFNSLNEVMTFQKNYYVFQQQIISNHELLIEQEKNSLSSDILQLDNTINTKKIEFEKELRQEIKDLKQQLYELSVNTTSIIQKLTNYFKKRSLKKKIHNNEVNLNFKIANSVQHLANALTKKNNRYQYIISHFTEAVGESCAVPLRNLETKKRIIDEINTFIYGALGEQKVVKELENLSDEYILINDLSLSFNTPIYNRQEDDYIKSIQIDHILISPSGIFLIETKNWSEQSLNNLNLRSPVQQIKRTNFALFKILTEEITKFNLNLTHHHWGYRKIPIRNLIVLTKLKPNEEFQYVKVLTLNELLSYVRYFKPTFSNKEIQEIGNYLLMLNSQHTV